MQPAAVANPKIPGTVAFPVSAMPPPASHCETAHSILAPTYDVAALLKNKLENPAFSLTPSESVALLTHCVQLGKQEGLKAQGKDLVVVIGNTGAGKSTFINYLYGCKMQRVIAQSLGIDSLDGKVVTVKPPAKGGTYDEVMQIGHGNTSMTFMPQIESDASGHTYCDCPGFLDNRGVEINLGNATNIKYALGQARSVKIAVLINFHSLKADRGRGLRDLIHICCSLFGSRENLVKYRNSLLLGITQIPLATSVEDPEETLSIDHLKRWLVAEKSIRDFDKATLEVLAERLFIYDPLDSNLTYKGALKREEILHALGNLHPLSSSLEIFKTVLTSDDLQGLIPIVNEIKSKIKEILQKHELFAEDFKQLAALQSCLNQLDIIDHPAMVRLAAETRHVITAYFQKLVHRFELNCKETDENLTSQTVKLLNTIKEGIEFFDQEVKKSIDAETLNKKFALLLLQHEARKKKMELTDVERDFRNCCLLADFLSAQDLLRRLEEGVAFFTQKFSSTKEVSGIHLEDLRTMYAKSKKTYDDNLREREENQKKLDEAQRRLEYERQQTERARKSAQAQQKQLRKKLEAAKNKPSASGVPHTQISADGTMVCHFVELPDGSGYTTFLTKREVP